MKAIAYTSPFVPAEWIAAHGLRPHRLHLRAAEGLTRGVCPYAGAMIHATLDGLDASALVLTTVCDQMRYAAAMLTARSSCPVFLLNVPSTWQTPAVRQLYFNELQRLGRFLVEMDGSAPDNAELADVMLAYDRARRESMENFVPGPCSSNTLGATAGLSSSAGNTVGQANRGTRHLISAGALKDNNASLQPTSDGIPLAIIGGPLMDSDDALFNLIEQAGGRVVIDATEGAGRTMPRRFDPTRLASDALQELADAYFSIPDAFRRPNSGLYEWLGRELAGREVRGIIFRRYVWCDLWHAELQRLKEWSPVPVLEIDVGPDDLSAPNRLQGRIEAFLEMLK
jgi:benzoyl-CoA reductase/2-hydroxyglutaryl-CoA dehydratase subunit BcrC/BadD/HgdB